MAATNGFETLEMLGQQMSSTGSACDCNCDAGGDTGGECDPCDCNEE